MGALRLTGPFTGATMRIRQADGFVVLAAMVIELVAGAAPARASPVDGNWAIRDLVLGP